MAEPVQERLIEEPETVIVLSCPRCAHVWHAATVLPGVWWGKGVTPESIAAICYCPRCEAAPPMTPEKEP